MGGVRCGGGGGGGGGVAAACFIGCYGRKGGRIEDYGSIYALWGMISIQRPVAFS